MRHRLNLDRLAQLLAASKVSQNHWALRLGLSRGHWSDIVNGKHPYPSAKTRALMVEVFGAHASDLFIAESGQSSPDVDFRIALSGRFELTAELGQGGMGTVYLANDLALGRLVALKAVSAEAVAGIGGEELLKEIRVVARLHHPNLLPLFDAGLGAQRPYYVMPYVREGSLRARLVAQGRFALGDVVTLVQGLTRGLGYAHAQRVLHCDIKPENILLSGDHPFLMDFGIARVLHSEADEWSGLRKDLDFSAGTPAYVSPEQASGDRALDPRSDIYSLACVVYEMLTGRAPFGGRTTQETVSLRFREPPPPLERLAPDVPVETARTLRRAMALDPMQRPASAEEFAEEFSLTTSARRSSPVRTAVALGIARAGHRLRRALGGQPAKGRERSRLGEFVDALRQDVAYAIRQRLRAPGLTAMALLTLSLGLGLSSSVFALVDGVLLRPLPFPRQDRLVALESVDSLGRAFQWVSADNWHDWRVRNRTLVDAAIYTEGRASVVVDERSRRVAWSWASFNLPAVLGMRVLHGRSFDSVEVAAGAGGALVSETLWRSLLGASREPGLRIQVDGRAMPVIGVVAQADVYPAGTELWTAYPHRQFGGASRNNINWRSVGRLTDGFDVAASEADLTGVARQIDASDPGSLYSRGVRVRPLRNQLVGDSTTLLGALFGAVVVLLLIACANLASASLAQGAAREREMAVRSALGAGRWRLIRQVLVDHALLSLVGGALGLGIAWGVIRASALLTSASLPQATDIRISATVLGGAFVASVLAGLLTGLAPALRASRSAPNTILAGGPRGIALGGRGLPGRVLVCIQVALAMMLVTGAGLLVRTVRSILQRPLGFEIAHVATAQVTLGAPQDALAGPAPLRYWEELTRRLREEPGVTGATVAASVPLLGGGTGFIEIEGASAAGAAAGYRIIGEDYFGTLGIPVRVGRDFDATDVAQGERVAVINARLAEAHWPGESPIGRRLRALSMEPAAAGQSPPWITIVGVADDTRHYGYRAEATPEMFVLYRQLPAWRYRSMTALVRSTLPEDQLLRQVARVVERLDPTVPADLDLLATAALRNTATERFAMVVFQAFGALSLLLAAIGIHGVLSFSVARRGRELAVRAALGADRIALLMMVARSGAGILLAGLALGTVGVVAGGRLIEGLLFGVTAGDGIAIGAAALSLAVAGAFAIALPALRATRADPMIALRGD